MKRSDLNPTVRQTIALILFVASVAIILNAAIVSFTPIVEKFRTVFLTIPSPGAGIPTVNVSIGSDFTAQGSLSAGNKITVHTDVFSTVSNWYDYYSCVAYLGSENFNGHNRFGLFVGFVNLTILPLNPASSPGAHDGFGQTDLIWASETDTWSVLVLTNDCNSPSPSFVDIPPANVPPLLHIGDLSQTYAWKFTEFNGKMTLVLVAFAVILWQPILEAVVGKRYLKKKIGIPRWKRHKQAHQELQ